MAKLGAAAKQPTSEKKSETKKKAAAAKKVGGFDDELIKKLLLADLNTKSPPASFGLYTKPLSDYVKMDNVVVSSMVQWLAKRTPPKSSSSATASSKKQNTSHMVGLTIARPMQHYEVMKKSTNSKCRAMSKKRSSFNDLIRNFFTSKFQNEPSTVRSVLKAVNHSSCIVVHTLPANAAEIKLEKWNNIKILGAVLFYSNEEAIFVNYLSVSAELPSALSTRGDMRLPQTSILKIQQEELGDSIVSSSLVTYRSNGLGSFLLSLMQVFAQKFNLHSTSKTGTHPKKFPENLEVYLQAATVEGDALQFYIRNGFKVVYEDIITEEHVEQSIDEDIIHQDVKSYLPKSLQEVIIEPQDDNSNHKAGIGLFFPTKDQQEYPMVLMKLDLLLHQHLQHNKSLWKTPFRYGLHERVASNRQSNRMTKAKDGELLPPKLTCGGCQEKDTKVSNDIRCLYCNTQQHASCCRQMDAQDLQVARWAKEFKGQNSDSHPYIVVCKKCDKQRVTGSLCASRVKRADQINQLQYVCHHPWASICNTPLTKCVECKQCVHAQCAKWVLDERPNTISVRAAVCLSCSICLETKHMNDGDEKAFETAEFEMVKFMYALRMKNNTCLKEGDYLRSNPLIVGSIDAGPMHHQEKFKNHWREKNPAVIRNARRIPPIGPLELHEFINPDRQILNNDEEQVSIYGRPGHHCYCPKIMQKDGALLRRETWLNDAIIQAYTGVMNQLTATERSILFCGPSFCLRWDASSKKSSKPHDTFDLLGDEIKEGNFSAAEKAEQDKRRDQLVATKVLGDFPRQTTDNRAITVNDIEAFGGYKQVYVVMQVTQSDHWWGVLVTCKSNPPDPFALEYEIVDTLSSHSEPNAQLKDWIEEKFGCQRVTHTSEPRRTVRKQEETSSCGVHQCYIMEELARKEEKWGSKPVSQSFIEDYRLIIGRRLLNYDGGQNIGNFREKPSDNGGYSLPLQTGKHISQDEENRAQRKKDERKEEEKRIMEKELQKQAAIQEVEDENLAHEAEEKEKEKKKLPKKARKRDLEDKKLAHAKNTLDLPIDDDGDVAEHMTQEWYDEEMRKFRKRKQEVDKPEKTGKMGKSGIFLPAKQPKQRYTRSRSMKPAAKSGTPGARGALTGEDGEPIKPKKRYKITDAEVLKDCQNRETLSIQRGEADDGLKEASEDEIFTRVCNWYFQSQKDDFAQRNEIAPYDSLEDFKAKMLRARNVWLRKVREGECSETIASHKVNQIRGQERNFMNMLRTEAKFHISKQIVWMWYVPSRVSKHKGKQRKTYPPLWKGMLSTGQEENLLQSWVDTEVSKSVVQYLITKAGQRFRLPAGDIRPDIGPVEPLGNRWIPPPRPPVRYLQEDLRTCVFSSFASCLCFIGHEDFARELHSKGKQYSPYIRNLKWLDRCIGEYLKRTVYKKKTAIDCVKKRFGRDGIDLLNLAGVLDGKPTLCILEGNDGGTEHAVTVYDHWIFDSNLKHAIPLTRESLNWCVMCEFVCIAEAISYDFRGSSLSKI